MLDVAQVPPKYQPLYDHLMTQASDEVTLSLRDIEALIGVPLPPIAGTRNWWSNSVKLRYTRAWLGAGWRVASGAFRIADPTVTFER